MIKVRNNILTIRIIIIFITMIFLMSLNLIPSVTGNNVDAINSSYIETPPTIDGVIEPGEWQEPVVTKSNVDGYYIKDLSSAGSVEMTIYIMNNEDTLFVAVEVVGDEFSLDDVVLIRFDDPHDEKYNEGEDFKLIGIYGMGDYNFRYIKDNDYENDKNHGGTTDGKGILEYYTVDQKFVAECSVPLDSGDSMDISTQPGETIGAKVFYIDQLLNQTEMAIYGGNPDDSTDWPDLVIAEKPDDEKDEKKDDDSSGLPGFEALFIIVGILMATIIYRKSGRTK